MSDSFPLLVPAAATVFDIVRPALYLLAPLFAVVLLVLALTHNPEGQQQQRTTDAKRQARIAYAFIASLAVLSALAGALPLSHASNAQAEALIQALLSLFLGIPVVYLPSQSINRINRLLVVALSSATFIALLSPFLPLLPPFLSPAVFLAYTLLALSRVAVSLVQFPKRPTALTPITIHIATQRTSANSSIPLVLSLPQSDASIPFSSSTIQHDQCIELEHRRRHHKFNSVDSSTSTITAVDHTRSPAPPPLALASDIEHQPIQNSPSFLRTQLIHNRTRSLLVFLVAAQIFLLSAYACELGSTTFKSISGSGVEVLRTVQAACTVLAVTGTMSAYLLHAYNTYLGTLSLPSLPSSLSRRVSRRTSTTAPAPYSSPESAPLASPTMDSGPASSAIVNMPAQGNPRSSRVLPAAPASHSHFEHHPLPPLPSTPAVPAAAVRQSQGPIILTYEPPKSDRSLFETTDTERQYDTLDRQERILFNSLSLGSLNSASGASAESDRTRVETGEGGPEGRTEENNGYGYGYEKKGKRMSFMPPSSVGHGYGAGYAPVQMEGPAQSHGQPQLAPLPKIKTKVPKRKTFEDPATYIKKRGSLPPPPRKLFGFTWDLGGSRSSSSSSLPVVIGSSSNRNDEKSSGDSSFIDLRKEKGCVLGLRSTISAPSTPTSPSMPKRLSRESQRETTRKLKRNTAPPASHPPSSFPFPTVASAEETTTTSPGFGCAASPTSRKLKKRPGSSGSSRPGTAESGTSGATGSGLGGKFVRVDMAAEKDDTIEVSEVDEQTPGTNLKKSFKLGVGRTLGPSLTLAAAAANAELPMVAPRTPVSPTVARIPNHPFAESVENVNGALDTDSGVDVDARSRDVVLHLEREMEETRVPCDVDVDVSVSRTITPTPTLKKTKSPALTITQDQQSQEQTPTPGPTPEKAKLRTLSKKKTPVLDASSAGLRKRTNSKSAVKSEWAPQSSSSFVAPFAGGAGSDSGTSSASTTPPASASASPSLPYNFPMIFSNSVASSSSLRLPHRSPSPSPLPLPPTPFYSHLPPSPSSTTRSRSPMPPSPSPSRTQQFVMRPSNPEPPSTASSSLRLSAMTIGSMKSAFAGVVGRSSGAGSSKSGRNANRNHDSGFATPTNATYAFGGGEMMIMEDDRDRDFMDLRDPFASPPPSGAVKRSPSNAYSRDNFFDSSEDGHGAGSYEDVFVGGPSGRTNVVAATGVGIGRRMSAWGRLPMPLKSHSSVANPISNVSSASSAKKNVGAARPSGKPRKHKKEKRTRKATLTGLGGLKNPSISLASGKMMKPVDGDGDFDIEEALLAQRLLKRLDDGVWENRV